jgi:hypothetical protein
MMGLLNRLFGKKQKAEFDPGDWTVFHRDSGYGPTVIIVTEAYRKSGVDTNRPAHVLLRLYIRELTDQGMPSGKELKVIENITDRVEAVAGSCGAVMVGRSTGNARREFHFYGPTAPPLLEALRQTMAQFKEHQYDLAEDHDPTWNAYLAICPTPREQRETSDMEVVRQLQQHGDRAELPRKVDHFVYFSSQDGRAAFQRAVVEQGFAVEDASQDPNDDGTWSFKLHVTRVDPVEISHIVQVTEWLASTAKHYGGEYDGWGCPVTIG